DFAEVRDSRIVVELPAWSGGAISVGSPVARVAQGDITALTVSPDGDYAVTGDRFGIIELWRVTEQGLERVESRSGNVGHIARIRDIVMVPGFNPGEGVLY